LGPPLCPAEVTLQLLQSQRLQRWQPGCCLAMHSQRGEGWKPAGPWSLEDPICSPFSPLLTHPLFLPRGKRKPWCVLSFPPKYLQGINRYFQKKTFSSSLKCSSLVSQWDVAKWINWSAGDFMTLFLPHRSVCTQLTHTHTHTPPTIA
jgi:hypothetical protein